MTSDHRSVVTTVPTTQWRDAAIGAAVVVGTLSAVVHLLGGVIASFEGRLGHDDLAGVVLWSLGGFVGPAAVVYVWRRRPGHPLLPWFVMIAAVNGLSTLLIGLFDLAQATATSGVLAMSVLTAWFGINAMANIAFIRVLATFPDGRFLRRSEHVVVVASWVLVAPVAMLAFFVPDAPFPGFLSLEPLANPWYGGVGVDPAVVDTIVDLANAASLVAVVMLVTRYRYLDPNERRRARWLALPLVLVVFGAVAELLLSAVVSQVAIGVTFGIRPVVVFTALALGLAGPGGPDVDRVLRRSAVYGVLWLAVAGAFVATSAAVGVVAGRRLPVEWAILLTIVATMVFQPARAWLERLADRWVFGPRADPTRMVARLGETLAAGLDLDTVLPRMSATLEEGLGLAWADVRLEPEASDRGAGAREPVLRVPIDHRGAAIGVVECGPKISGAFTDEDRAVVETLARQAALTVDNVRLARELVVRAQLLAESRHRLVKAQQVERRRIERNIHDGVQQDLVGLMAYVGALQQADNGGVRSDDLVVVKDGLTRLLSELRELAAGIHPSILTDLGLVPSVEALASRNPIPVTVRADERLREQHLPEEVAGVAYFTVAEALANSAKHSGAGEVEVVLGRSNGALRVVVRDDGGGFDAAMLDSGQGLTNLVERVDALDGTLDVSSGDGVGTTVTATIDLPVTADLDATP